MTSPTVQPVSFRYVNIWARWMLASASTHFTSTSTWPVDDEVNAIRATGFELLPLDLYGLSDVDLVPGTHELITQTQVIHGFEQAWSESLVDLDRIADDVVGDGIDRSDVGHARV